MLNFKQRHILQILCCLFLVYISWGSCFISIKFSLESFPAFMMCGLRMLPAGVLLYFVTWLRGERTSPTWKDVQHNFILAFFMVFISSGFLTKGQESVFSGSAALLLGSVPIQMVLGGWLFCGDPRPTFLQCCGLIFGTSGLVMLSLHQSGMGHDSPLGLALVFTAALGWVVGSFYSKNVGHKSRLSVMRTSALIMAFGGLQSLAWAFASGEFQNFSFLTVSTKSWAALAYLIGFGAIIAYTCYFWLLMNTRTVVAISYEFVNPVIGVFLGWFLANEHVDYIIILACVTTVTSVFFVVSEQKKI